MSKELSQQEREAIAAEWNAQVAAKIAAEKAEKRRVSRKAYDDERKKKSAPVYIRVPTADKAKAARSLLKKMLAAEKVCDRTFEAMAEKFEKLVDGEIQKKNEAAKQAPPSQ